MKTILLTGPIGSGKSEVSRALRSRGFQVYDCDSACKALYESVPGLKTRIEDAIGVPFQQIAVIFTDPEKMAALERVVFPELKKDIERWRLTAGETAFIESATAASKKDFDGIYDEVWLVVAPLQTRMKRNPRAAQRDTLQSFDLIEPSRTIENSSSIEDLYEQIKNIEI